MVEVVDSLLDPDLSGHRAAPARPGVLRRELPPRGDDDDAGDAYPVYARGARRLRSRTSSTSSQPRAPSRTSRVPFESARRGRGSARALIARPEPGAETDALEREAASYLGAERVLALRSPRRRVPRAAARARAAQGRRGDRARGRLRERARRAARRRPSSRSSPTFIRTGSRSRRRRPRPRSRSRTRAMLVAHPLGQPAELDALYGLAEERGLELFEDGCESLGARFADSRLGRSPCASVFRLPLGAHAPGFQVCAARAARLARARTLAPRLAEQRIGDGLAGARARRARALGGPHRRAPAHRERVLRRVLALRRVPRAAHAGAARCPTYSGLPAAPHALRAHRRRRSREAARRERHRDAPPAPAARRARAREPARDRARARDGHPAARSTRASPTPSATACWTRSSATRSADCARSTASEGRPERSEAAEARAASRRRAKSDQTRVSQLSYLRSRPWTASKNVVWIVFVIGPREPAPISRSSTSRTGVSSAAVPVRKTSSAQ